MDPLRWLPSLAVGAWTVLLVYLGAWLWRRYLVVPLAKAWRRRRRLWSGSRLKGLWLGRRPRYEEAEWELVLLALASELEAGASFPLAVQRVARDAPPAMGRALERLARDTAVGDWQAALAHWAARHPFPGVQDLAAAVAVQRDTGGALAPLLRQVARLTQDGRLQREQGRAKTAEARYSAWILAVTPLLLVLYFLAARPDFLAPLWTEPSGRLALAYGLGSWLMGLIWIRRLVGGLGRGR